MKIFDKVSHYLPEDIKNQVFVQTWSFFNVPLLFWLRPKIVELNEKRTVINIPLNRRTKNHLNSMYFGVLAAGADCAGGIMAMKLIKESGKNISLAFKDFKETLSLSVIKVKRLLSLLMRSPVVASECQKR